MKKNLLRIALGIGVLVLALGLIGLAYWSRSENRGNEKVVTGRAGLALVAKESLEEIIKRSDAASIGKVASVSEARLASEDGKFFEDANAYREVTIEVEKFLFNDIGITSPVRLIVLGGKVKLPKEAVLKKGYSEDTEVFRVYEDEAQFEVGEKVLVFLHKGSFGLKSKEGKEVAKERLALTGAWQGKYTVVNEEAINYDKNRNKSLKEIMDMIEELR
ncbi:MAG: hypothetical protein PWQ91_914 [Eubacteriales bacterium]|nr:hypothetical protein [Eubacteriales bacterium]MDN5363853.1 hypothetical protein [Eubacteriales bacterium]